jgi:DNA-binding LacI/PurR family transcriptional regulator
MNDVAAAAGVAQSTVSRVLNDAPLGINVSPATRERVRAIARELGYRPHPIARALRGAPTMLLGAVVRDITDPFFSGAIDALSIKAKERGYSVVLGHAGAKADEALALTAVLEARQCDAIVLLGDFRAERRLLADLRNAQVRVVGLWQGSERRGLPFPVVGVDNRTGVHAALDHLMEHGHRRIAFVGGEAGGDVHERHVAYDGYLSAAGIARPPGYAPLVPNTTEGGALALTRLLEQAPRPTAIFVATDLLAMGVLHAAYAHGIVVPDELSVIAFDDIALARSTVPALTTVRMPLEEIAAAGVELAIGAASREATEGAELPRIVFQPKLIVRGSTAPVAPAMQAA